MGAGRTDNETENLSNYSFLYGIINNVLSRWELVAQIMKLRTCPTTVSSTELFQLLLVYSSTPPRYLNKNKINLTKHFCIENPIIPIAKSSLLEIAAVFEPTRVLSLIALQNFEISHLLIGCSVSTIDI